MCAGARDAASFVGAPSAGGDLASAPAPGSPAPAADTLFTLSAAGMVLAADSLKLTSVATATLFSTSGSKAGVYTTGQSQHVTDRRLLIHPVLSDAAIFFRSVQPNFHLFVNSTLSELKTVLMDVWSA